MNLYLYLSQFVILHQYYLHHHLFWDRKNASSGMFKAKEIEKKHTWITYLDDPVVNNRLLVPLPLVEDVGGSLLSTTDEFSWDANIFFSLAVRPPWHFFAVWPSSWHSEHLFLFLAERMKLKKLTQAVPLSPGRRVSLLVGSQACSAHHPPPACRRAGPRSRPRLTPASRTGCLPR